MSLVGCPDDDRLPPAPIDSVGDPTGNLSEGSVGTAGTVGDSTAGDTGVQGCPPLDTGGADDTAGTTGDTACVADEDCGPCAACIGEVCVGTGQLRFTLTFTTDSDFDLHVVTPAGIEIYYANPTAGGGDLDVDQCIEPCGSGTHVENIFFPEMPPCGQFTTYVVNFDGRSSGEFQIEVDGVANGSFSGSLSPLAGEVSEMFTFETCN